MRGEEESLMKELERKAGSVLQDSVGLERTVCLFLALLVTLSPSTSISQTIEHLAHLLVSFH